MKYKYLFASFAMLFVDTVVAADASLDTDKKKMSYAIGAQIGNDFKRSGLDIDIEAMSKAISDVINGNKPALSQNEFQQALNLLREQQMKKQMAAGDKNKKAGEAFLAENKKKPGIITLPSGVQYKVIKKGSGKSPTPANSVVAHYEGRLINGTVFDSSIKRGKPATFPVTGVIKGWVEILQKMKVGSKWEVYIPSDLAYGARGTGPVIGPNATLIFDIELLEIK
ncbi:MAG TPA: FKBP-type peptidyl-prolyl cis-trans isomerase [Gammaproteobacteria bacterium]|nr:FKBP-type peptidyl-prolyl cis-trans isomerase [Gammaproteobacteria bacterium]